MAAPIDVPTLTAQLTAARAAYHSLMTGSLREKVDHNGTSITYTRATANDLQGYIDGLESSIDATTSPQTRRRMIVNVF